MRFLKLDDLLPFAEIAWDKAEAMIADAEALAVIVAPCLTDPDLSDAHVAGVKAILRGAVLRWNDTGSGALKQQTTGPFSVTVDDRQDRKSLFWPSEIEQLQAICTSINGTDGAFSVDTLPIVTVEHSLICSVMFGATYCSCGADLSGDGPIFGS